MKDPSEAYKDALVTLLQGAIVVNTYAVPVYFDTLPQTLPEKYIHIVSIDVTDEIGSKDQYIAELTTLINIVSDLKTDSGNAGLVHEISNQVSEILIKRSGLPDLSANGFELSDMIPVSSLTLPPVKGRRNGMTRVLRIRSKVQQI